MIVIGAMLWGMTGSITEWVLANTDFVGTFYPHDPFNNSREQYFSILSY
ncbi:hypothetical protein MEZE111188_16365 [Mesobacillus zeae]